MKAATVQRTGKFCSALQLEEGSDKTNFDTWKVLEKEEIEEIFSQNICSCQENKISKD